MPQTEECYCYRHEETGRAIHIFSPLFLAVLEQLLRLKTHSSSDISRLRLLMLRASYKKQETRGVLQNVMKMVDRLLFVIIDGLDETSAIEHLVVVLSN